MPLFVKGQPRPPGAGRKKGSRNKATIERLKREALGHEVERNEMPLDFMLRTMRNIEAPYSERFLAARSAAPFCHPQLQAVAHKHMDADGRPIARSR
jgi:hypothetical protein